MPLKPSDNIRSVMLSGDTHERLREFADSHNISVSEAMSVAIAKWMKTKDFPLRKRPTKRVTFWMKPSTYNRFSDRLAELNENRPADTPRTTINDVISRTLEVMK